MTDLASTSDEQLIELVRRERSDAAFEEILERYDRTLRRSVRKYFAPGLEPDDLLSVARIAAWEAALDWDPARSSFRGFLHVVVNAQLATAVNAGMRVKHQPLSTARSISEPFYFDGEKDRTLEDVLDRGERDVADIAAGRLDAREQLASIVGRLSSLERHVVVSRCMGDSYDETARRLNRSVKTIDNARQRVLAKARATRAHSAPRTSLQHA